MLDRLRLAKSLREPIRAADTDALRLIDGRGDGVPDLELEEYAGRWLAQTRGPVFPDWLRTAAAGRPLFWKRLTHEKSPPVWIAGDHEEKAFAVRENGLRFEIDFSAGYSQGLFLDQRDNRAELRRISTGKRVLNCFAYTCAFGVAAAAEGAETVNIDLSKRYLEWGRRNYALNSLDPAAHGFLQGDAFDWLRRFGKKGRHFDHVVLDPPTFSRSGKGRVFTIAEGYGELARLAAALLAPGGALFCSTNQRTLTEAAFRRLLLAGLGGAWDIRFRRMPADFTGEPYLKACWLTPA
jgi:23S rRNA (cytosine1962-C5)-methyltransferase